MTTLNIPQTLQDRLREQKVIPFIGAGVSMTVQRHDGIRLFPNWKQLLLSAADWFDQETKGKDATAIRALLDLDEPQYLNAANLARKAMGGAWYAYLSDQIDLSHADVADESLALARAIWGLNSQLVLTTNYDRVMRWACPKSGNLHEWDIEATAEQAQFLQQGVKHPTVWHLHGHIGNKTNLILTPDGYQRLYSDDEAKSKHPAAIQTLRSSLASYSFFFIGFSLDDEHFGAQLKAVEDIYAGATGPHYALVKAAHVVSFQQAHQNIGIIPFTDFGEPLLQVVRALGELNGNTEKVESTADVPASGPIKSATETQPATHYSLDNRVFFVPYRAKGDQVIGREDALAAVHKQLNEWPRTSIGQAASFHGLGGLGKTQLAVEYAYQYQHEYPNDVIWITADQDIESQLTKLSDEAKWLAPSSEPKQKQDAAKNRLKSYSDCLLIFDNLDRFDSIANYLPDLQANPHILVTSRFDFADFPPIPLDPLSDEDAYKLLVQEAGNEPHTDAGLAAAQGIAHKLGGLPLALELAGAYLRHRQLGWERYSALLQENPRAALKGRFLSSFTKHEADLYATLKISDYVFDEEPLLRDIVNLLTWSGAAPMNLSLMSAVLAVKSETELLTALALGESLRLLVKSPKGDGYALHRLVGQVRREEILLEQRSTWVSDICQRLGDWFQPIGEEFSRVTEYEAQLDHLHAWQQHALQHASQHASRLLWLRAYPLFHQGRYQEAKDLIGSLYEKFLDSQNNDLVLEACILNDLGFVINQLGDPIKALIYGKKALSIRRRLFGDRNSDTAVSYNNVAIAYGRREKYKRRALVLLKKALKLYLDLHGDKNPGIARSYNNIGSLYGELGAHQEELKFTLKALNLYQELYGEADPATALAYSNVASAYGGLCMYAEASSHVESALQICQQIYGNGHPYEAAILNNAAGLYGVLNPKLALEYVEKAITIRLRFFGKDNSDTIQSLIKKSVILMNLGRTTEAATLLDRLLQDLPQGHSDREKIRQQRLQVQQRYPGTKRRKQFSKGK